MRKILVLMFIVVIALTSTLSVKAKQADKIIKNRLFSIFLITFAANFLLESDTFYEYDEHAPVEVFVS